MNQTTDTTTQESVGGLTAEQIQVLRVLFVLYNETSLEVLTKVSNAQHKGLGDVAPAIIAGMGRAMALTTLILKTMGLSNTDMAELGQLASNQLKSELHPEPVQSKPN